MDLESGLSVRLFHPRQMRWGDHFTWTDDSVTIVGTTPTGRATVLGLEMNGSLQRTARALWRELGLRPEADS